MTHRDLIYAKEHMERMIQADPENKKGRKLKKGDLRVDYVGTPKQILKKINKKLGLV